MSKVNTTKEGHVLPGNPPLTYGQYDAIAYHISLATGRVFTLVDASIADKQQNKAFKDCIRGYFRELYDELWARTEKTIGDSSTPIPPEQRVTL